ncbi:hypothetical protein CSUI_009927, partial [Cystoisospora suis]
MMTGRSFSLNYEASVCDGIFSGRRGRRDKEKEEEEGVCAAVKELYQRNKEYTTTITLDSSSLSSTSTSSSSSSLLPLSASPRPPPPSSLPLSSSSSITTPSRVKSTCSSPSFSSSSSPSSSSCPETPVSSKQPSNCSSVDCGELTEEEEEERERRNEREYKSTERSSSDKGFSFFSSFSSPSPLSSDEEKSFSLQEEHIGKREDPLYSSNDTAEEEEEKKEEREDVNEVSLFFLKKRSHGEEEENKKNMKKKDEAENFRGRRGRREGGRYQLRKILRHVLKVNRCFTDEEIFDFIGRILLGEELKIAKKYRDSEGEQEEREEEREEEEEDERHREEREREVLQSLQGVVWSQGRRDSNTLLRCLTFHISGLLNEELLPSSSSPPPSSSPSSSLHKESSSPPGSLLSLLCKIDDLYKKRRRILDYPDEWIFRFLQRQDKLRRHRRHTYSLRCTYTPNSAQPSMGETRAQEEEDERAVRERKKDGNFLQHCRARSSPQDFLSSHSKQGERNDLSQADTSSSSFSSEQIFVHPSRRGFNDTHVATPSSSLSYSSSSSTSLLSRWRSLYIRASLFHILRRSVMRNTRVQKILSLSHFLRITESLELQDLFVDLIFKSPPLRDFPSPKTHTVNLLKCMYTAAELQGLPLSDTFAETVFEHVGAYSRSDDLSDKPYVSYETLDTRGRRRGYGSSPQIFTLGIMPCRNELGLRTWTAGLFLAEYLSAYGHELGCLSCLFSSSSSSSLHSCSCCEVYSSSSSSSLLRCNPSAIPRTSLSSLEDSSSQLTPFASRTRPSRQESSSSSCSSSSSSSSTPSLWLHALLNKVIGAQGEGGERRRERRDKRRRRTRDSPACVSSREKKDLSSSNTPQIKPVLSSLPTCLSSSSSPPFSSSSSSPSQTPLLCHQHLPSSSALRVRLPSSSSPFAVLELGAGIGLTASVLCSPIAIHSNPVRSRKDQPNQDEDLQRDQDKKKKKSFSLSSSSHHGHRHPPSSSCSPPPLSSARLQTCGTYFATDYLPSVLAVCGENLVRNGVLLKSLSSHSPSRDQDSSLSLPSSSSAAFSSLKSSVHTLDKSPPTVTIFDKHARNFLLEEKGPTSDEREKGRTTSPPSTFSSSSSSSFFFSIPEVYLELFDFSSAEQRGKLLLAKIAEAISLQRKKKKNRREETKDLGALQLGRDVKEGGEIHFERSDREVLVADGSLREENKKEREKKEKRKEEKEADEESRGERRIGEKERDMKREVGGIEASSSCLSSCPTISPTQTSLSSSSSSTSASDKRHERDREEEEEEEEEEGPLLIIGSDLIYDEELNVLLAKALSVLLRVSPKEEKRQEKEEEEPESSEMKKEKKVVPVDLMASSHEGGKGEQGKEGGEQGGGEEEDVEVTGGDGVEERKRQERREISQGRRRLLEKRIVVMCSVMRDRSTRMHFLNELKKHRLQAI